MIVLYYIFLYLLGGIVYHERRLCYGLYRSLSTVPVIATIVFDPRMRISVMPAGIRSYTAQRLVEQIPSYNGTQTETLRDAVARPARARQVAAIACQPRETTSVERATAAPCNASLAVPAHAPIAAARAAGARADTRRHRPLLALISALKIRWILIHPRRAKAEGERSGTLNLVSGLARKLHARHHHRAHYALYTHPRVDDSLLLLLSRSMCPIARQHQSFARCTDILGAIHLRVVGDQQGRCFAACFSARCKNTYGTRFVLMNTGIAGAARGC